MNTLYTVIQKLEKYRIELFFILLGINFLFYFCVFDYLDFFKALYDAAALFALDIRVGAKNIDIWWEYTIYILAILSGLYTVLSVIGLFVKDKMKENLITQAITGDNKHIIVMGLGDSNRAYIDSELKKDQKESGIVIVEKDKNNPYIEKYEKDLAIMIGDASDETILRELNIENAKHIVISTANDMINLEIATQILSINNEAKLFIHLEDRNLRHFHKENGILAGTDIKVYSYQEEAARELFEKRDIDGEGMELIHSSEPYAITVVGNTALAYEVIAQACIMGQLPNANQLTIYCVDKECDAFKESVELHFPEIKQVPNVTLKFKNLDVDAKSFYTDALWDTEMTNIILCFDNDQKNLDIASNLTNLTFLESVVDKKMKTKILIAMFNGYSLSDKIKRNNDMFKHLHVFGGISEINDEKYVIAGERDKQAIATNFIYNNIEPKLLDFETYTYEYNTYGETGYGGTGFIETTEDGWAMLSYFKKESNRAVADQMKIKLKYLGLSIEPSSEANVKALYDINKELFYKHMKDRLLLAKMEHNRWNTFHYLNGFNAIDFVSKEEKDNLKSIHEAKKVHMCLVDFNEFKNKSDELERLGYEKGIFEGYDFMINEHIPLILANASYQIVSLNK